MRLRHFGPLQRAIWTHPKLSEPVEVLDGGGAVAWSGHAVEDAPGDVDVPRTTLARRSARVRRLMLRESDAPPLARGARLRWRGRVERVDGTPAVADAVITVALAGTR